MPISSSTRTNPTLNLASSRNPALTKSVPITDDFQRSISHQLRGANYEEVRYWLCLLIFRLSLRVCYWFREFGRAELENRRGREGEEEELGDIRSIILGITVEVGDLMEWRGNYMLGSVFCWFALLYSSLVSLSIAPLKSRFVRFVYFGVVHSSTAVLYYLNIKLQNLGC